MDHSKKANMTGCNYNADSIKHTPAVNYINITRHPEGGIANVELKRTVTKVITFPQNTATVASSGFGKNQECGHFNDTSPSGYSSTGSNASLFASDSKLTSSQRYLNAINSADNSRYPTSFVNVNRLLASPQSSLSSLSEGSKNSNISVSCHQVNLQSEIKSALSSSYDKYSKGTKYPEVAKVSPSRISNSGVMTNITVIPRPSDCLEVIKNRPTEVSFKVSRHVAPRASKHFFKSGESQEFSSIQQSVDALTLQMEEEMKIMNSHIQEGSCRQKSPPPYYGVHLTSVDCFPSSSPKFGRTHKSMQISPLQNSFSSNFVPRSEASPSLELESQIPFGVCAGCKQVITDLSSACHAMGHLYHSCCFRCSSCGRRLMDKSFYNVSGKIFCEEDYLYSGFQQTTEKCVICGHFIIETILQALGKSYHPGCFRCSACNQCLDGEPFTVDILDRILCINDYNNLYAPRCYACGLSIAPKQGNEGCVRIMSMDKDFHIECYKCKDCLIQLSDVDGQLCYPLEDILLCRECHIKRLC